MNDVLHLIQLLFEIGDHERGALMLDMGFLRLHKGITDESCFKKKQKTDQCSKMIVIHRLCIRSSCHCNSKQLFLMKVRTPGPTFSTEARWPSATPGTIQFLSALQRATQRFAITLLN